MKRIPTKGSILLLLLFTMNLIAVAQPRRFNHLTSSDGISQSEIYAFLEDSKGFMWIGTVDGLNRYDGYKMDIFNIEQNGSNSLSNNSIRSLSEDNTGKIWIGTDDGLNIYDPDRESISQIRIASEKNKFAVWSLYIQDNRIFVGGTSGLWWGSTTPSNDLTYSFKNIEFFDNNFIRAIIRAREGGCWILTSHSISRVVFNEETNRPIVIDDIRGGNLNLLTSLAEDSSGNLWVASETDGIIRYTPKTRQSVQFKENGSIYGPSSNKCSVLKMDIQGNLWIGTLDQGLCCVPSIDQNKSRVRFERIMNEPFNTSSLGSNLIYSLYVTRNNQLWVGTIGSGISILDPEQKSFIHYLNRNPELQNANFIRSVCSYSRDEILVGTHANGLLLLDRKTGKYKELGFDTQSVFYISKYEGDRFFVCTSTGMHLVALTGKRLKLLSSYGYAPSFYIEKSQGRIYWLATLNGVVRLEIDHDRILSETKYTVNTHPGISEDNCRVLLYDKTANTLYLGTEGGGLNVITLDEEQYPASIEFHQKSVAQGALSSNYIRSLLKEGNTLWIGTYEGLNRVDPNPHTDSLVFKTYTRTDGLPSNMIQSLIQDEEHNLWIGTNGGLSRMLVAKEQFVNYSVHDGIQSNEFSEHAACRTEDGEIIFGGINGINAFYPDKIQPCTSKPRTSITRFYLFNEKIRPQEVVGKKIVLRKSIVSTDSILLQPRQKNIGFEFSAMIYPNAEKICYAYMLEGFDNDWHYTNADNRIATYTNLKYGKYRFRVRSTNADGVWEDSVREVFIHIRTPLMLTWVAVTIYLVLGIVSTFFLIRYIIRRYTSKRKKALEEQHKQKMEELNQLRTRFFINISHDIRTPLTLIREPLEAVLEQEPLSEGSREKLQLIRRNVRRLNYMVDQLLDFRKAETSRLTPSLVNEDIVSFTENEILHFSYAIQQKELKLSIRHEASQILVPFDRAMISKVYFNIISNAVKFTNPGGSITIDLQETDQDWHNTSQESSKKRFVRVEIRDSGIGLTEEQSRKVFDRFYQASGHDENGYGIGLSHTKDLIEAQNGHIDIESKVGVGTAIRFYLPMADPGENLQPIADTSTEDLYIDPEPAEPANTAPDSGENRQQRTILIVEDNVDMRNFIRNELQKTYRVICASDGVEGLKSIRKQMPDLIVSDIIMPNMDGLELCQRVKSDITISHIPLILLTAKDEDQTKYEGIDIGADDYIVKPFEMKYLLIRIRNLITSRENLRRLFKESQTILEPAKITVTTIDEKFMTSLMEAIERGIPDPDFSVTTLENRLAMSHAQFYRKLKGLTGMSGQEFLLSMRMKRAYQLLSQNNGLQISEVAYMVGFTTPKYFSKCFREIYGFSPSHLNKSNRTENIAPDIDD